MHHFFFFQNIRTVLWAIFFAIICSEKCQKTRKCPGNLWSFEIPTYLGLWTLDPVFLGVSNSLPSDVPPLPDYVPRSQVDLSQGTSAGSEYTDTDALTYADLVMPAKTFASDPEVKLLNVSSDIIVLLFPYTKTGRKNICEDFFIV